MKACLWGCQFVGKGDPWNPRTLVLHERTIMIPHYLPTEFAQMNKSLNDTLWLYSVLRM
jgi:hypothetical protein